MPLKLKQTGIQKNVLILKGAAQVVKPEVQKICNDAMDTVFDVSQQLVPIGHKSWEGHKAGELMRSGRVVPTQFGARIIYSAPYAARIEYDANLKHENGQAFFVGEPFNAIKGEVKLAIEQAAVAPLKK